MVIIRECHLVPLYNVRFIQQHVSDTTVKAKRAAIRLKRVYGDEWKEFISEAKNLEEHVFSELKRIELTFPIQGFFKENNFIVFNGTHTSYALMLEGEQFIQATPYSLHMPVKERYYSFDDIIHKR
jgi:hypothetical protein